MDILQNDNSSDLALNQIACLGDQKYPSFELRIIFEYLSSIGHADWCSQQLAELGLSTTNLVDKFITAHQALEGLTRVTRDFYKPGFGCEVAKRYCAEDFGALGVCISHAENLGESMSICQMYYDFLGSFTDIANIVEGDVYINRLIDVARLDPDTLQFLFELTVMGMSSVGEQISGVKIEFLVVRFTSKLREHEKLLYQDYFNCKVEDQSKFNEWVVDLKSLDVPLKATTMSPETSISELTSLLSDLHGEQGLVDHIDGMLKASPGDFPGPDMVSQALGMSSRTMRRRLSNMGTSFSALIDKVRCQLAINLIQYDELSNEALAEELGYSDAANFYNAFKKWTGHSPNHYRSNMR